MLSYLFFLIQESSQDKNLAIHLFYKTLLPYLELLSDWVVSGKLDNLSEFMISGNNESWANGFKIKTKQVGRDEKLCVPVFFDGPLQGQVLVIGKSMRLIRQIEEDRMLLKEHYLDNICDIMKSRLHEKLKGCLVLTVKPQYPEIPV